MTRKAPQEQHQDVPTMTDPNDTLTGDLLPDAPADDHQERAASLNLLDRQAAALEQVSVYQEETAPGEPEKAPSNPAELAAQVQSLLGVGVNMLAPAFPSLLQIYTPETCQQVGAAVAPVMVKHGWTMGDAYDKWKEEINLAIVAVPLGVATYFGILGDIEQRKKAAQAKHQEQIHGEAVNVG